MLDPLTSISLATNVVQLVDFGLKVATTGRQIAATGSTQEQRHLEHMSKNISRLCDEIESQSQEASVAGIQRTEHKESQETLTSSTTMDNTDMTQVSALAYRTRNAAEELDMLLQGLKLDNPGRDDTNAEMTTGSRKRKRSAFNRTIKALWKDSDVQKLRKQLGELQQELILSLNVMQR